jgi:hypothetical protein
MIAKDGLGERIFFDSFCKKELLVKPHGLGKIVSMFRWFLI